MRLVNPPTYVSVTQMRGFANDFDLTSYTDSQLQDKLCAASAAANSIMHRNLLAHEETIRYIGDGTDRLDLAKSYVLYIKRAQIVLPGGQTGFSIPVNELLVDYANGTAFEYAPLYWAGAGYRSIFPYGAPIDFTIGWGLGYTAAVAPAWSAVDVTGGGLPLGQYNVAVTARTFWGETTALVSQKTTASGSFDITMASGIGVYVYRVYVSSATDNTTISSSPAAADATFTVDSTAGMTAGSQWLVDSGVGAQEVVTLASAPSGSTVTILGGLTYAHTAGAQFIPAPLLVQECPVTAFGASPITTEINTLTPANGLFADALPWTDTSAPEIPWEIIEAVRLLALSSIFEQNNLANRGVYQQRSGDRLISWASTEGRSGQGKPTLWEQASNLLGPYVYRGLI